ncbi:competence type IV pilus major pilin ComGC [Anaerorhabdus sp.]|uniref:competence type IV pilus major pilin ComGC n=2 Tax=Anaerorhabdus sp. TaxID=1872524 RepID=UPI002FCA60F6
MNNRKKKGFTLIELIVVIAILAVLGLLIVPQISGYIDATQATTCQNNRKLVERAITVAEAKSGKTETFTTPEQVAAIKDSLYDGGKICPKEGTITITGHKVTCSIHKDETGGTTGKYPNPGSLLEDKYKDDISKATDFSNVNTTYKYGDIVKSNGKLWVYIDQKPSGSAAPGNPMGISPWKEISNNFSSLSRYEKGDIVMSNGKYYICENANSRYLNSIDATNGDSQKYFKEIDFDNNTWDYKK